MTDKTLYTIEGACFIAGGIMIGIPIGATVRRRAIRKRIVEVMTLVIKATGDAIDNSFETGTTKQEVVEQFKSDIKFIEQVL